MLKLLILDMDGVVFEGSNFWLEFHTAMGTRDAALELWQNLAESDYERLSRETAELWAGRSAALYFQMIRSRAYVAGIDRVIEYAAREGLRTAIVTSGPYHLARRADQRLGVDVIRANRLGIDSSGCFDGTVEVQVDNAHKDRAAQTVQEALGITQEETAVIGDGENDVPMTRLARVAVGYRVKDAEARGHFGVNIPSGPVSQAISALAGEPVPA